jgi:hypothetical protein
VATIYVACSDFTVVDFFQQTLAIPLVLLCFLGWKIYKKTTFVSTTEADLVSGRREMDLHAEKVKEQEERQSWGVLKRYLVDIPELIVGYGIFCVKTFQYVSFGQISSFSYKTFLCRQYFYVMRMYQGHKAFRFIDCNDPQICVPINALLPAESSIATGPSEPTCRTIRLDRY